jgi:hypothetical protein
MMRKLFTWLLLACLCPALAASAMAAGGRKLVLVTSVDSNVLTIPAPDIRRLFLGVPISTNNGTVQPLRNATDPLLEEVFLQKVLFMSRESYDRILLTKVMHGGSRPVIFNSEDQLLNALNANRNAVTYMWSDAASNKTTLRIVAELWQS